MSQGRAIVWGEVGQETLIRETLALADLELIGVGARRPDATAALATSLDAPRIDDIRAAIQHPDVDLLWLASRDRLDESERRLIRDVGVRCATSLPRPASVAEILSVPEEGATASLVPLMRYAPGFRTASETFEQFGAVSTIAITVRSDGRATSLLGHLYDAMDLLAHLGLEAQSVDASFSGAMPDVPETLPALTGTVTAHLRLAGRGGAVINISDDAGGWFRGITMLGSGGCLRVTDESMEWVGPDGAVIDTSPPSDDVAPASLPARLLAADLERVRADSSLPLPPFDAAGRLALCEAVRLSCRTGQGESPFQLLQVLGRP